MRRIRLFFVLLALGLLVPMALLVRSALRSAEFERQVRHRTIAERTADEMERALSSLLQRENERPFGHYRFYYVPTNVASQRYALTRSPLSEPSEPAFVVGRFEVGPDGQIRSPVVPRNPSLAAQRGDWRPSPLLERELQDLEALVTLASLVPARQDGNRFPLRPGATRPLEPDALEVEPEPAPAESLDTYRALSWLNRGAVHRSGTSTRSLALHLRPLRHGAGLAVIATVDGSPEPLGAGELRFAASAGRPETFFSPDAVLQGAPPKAQMVHVHRLESRLLEREHLVLGRAVAAGRTWFWQGAILEVDAFTRWLDATVFAGSPLASHVRRDYLVAGAPAPPLGGGPAYVYLHRFDRPFDDLAVRLAVSPLASSGGAQLVSLLALLVLVAGSGGLYALYRMVEVTVGFAQRRSNFAAAVSHELKTPITAIRMYAEMLGDGMASSQDQVREYAATIGSESERLSRLIDNVLEFSRLEQGTREVELVSGSLGDVVSEAVRILEPQARQAGFSLELELEPDLPAVRFDRDALMQVVFNLVDNALKYAREAEQRSIALRCSASDRGVQLSVRDRGPGVPAGHLARIFEAFYRPGNELTRTTKGTGIGLALVQGLAQRMGAAVSARNADGGGFEVTLSFPAAA